MTKANLTSGVDAFDRRLQQIDRLGNPPHEVEAARLVYERVRTARAICEAYLSNPPSDVAVLAVMAELGAQARHSGQGPNTEE